MTPGPCLVTGQAEVSPLKMDREKQVRSWGSFAPMSMFLWAGQLLPELPSSRASHPSA